MLKFAIVGFCLLVLSGTLQAGEMGKQQQEVWGALEEQIALFMDRNWEKHAEFIHPEIVFWGSGMPAPRDSGVSGPPLGQLAANLTPKPLGHNLVPLTVLVLDDVAIINFYLVTLHEGADGPEWATMRGHNTWKRDDGRWRLIATYNSPLD